MHLVEREDIEKMNFVLRVFCKLSFICQLLAAFQRLVLVCFILNSILLQKIMLQFFFLLYSLFTSSWYFSLKIALGSNEGCTT